MRLPAVVVWVRVLNTVPATPRLAILFVAGAVVFSLPAGAVAGVRTPAVADLAPQEAEASGDAAVPRSEQGAAEQVEAERRILLGDANIEKKFAAGQRLLRDRGDAEFLAATLVSSADDAVREAIIRAFAVEEHDGIVRPALPLVAQLVAPVETGGVEPNQLLNRLHDYFDIIHRKRAEKLVGTLLGVLQDPGFEDQQANVSARLGAVRVLSWLGCLQAVPSLIGFLDPAAGADLPPGPLLDALRTITLRDFGTDLTQWRAWWEANGALSREQILVRYVQELRGEMATRSQEIEKRYEQRLAELGARLQACDDEVRDLGGRLLDLEPQAVRRFLDHRDRALRLKAFEVVRALSSRPEPPKELLGEVRDRLVTLLETGNPERDASEVVMMIDTLGKLNPSTEPARLVLIRLLKAGLEMEIQVAAAIALRNGEDPEGSVGPALKDRLAEVLRRVPLPDTLVTELVKSVASRWNQDDPQLLTRILWMEGDKVSTELKATVCRKLGDIGDVRAIPDLAKVLVPQPPQPADVAGDLWIVRASAARALTSIGLAAKQKLSLEEWRPRGQELQSILEQGLGDPKPEVAIQCVRHIAELRAEGGYELLVRSYEEGRPIKVREELLRQIAIVGQAAAFPVLARALVREEAATGTSNGAANGGATIVDTARKAIADVCTAEVDDKRRLLLWSQVAAQLLELGSPAPAAWALGQLLERFPVAGDEVPADVDARLKSRAQVRFQLAQQLPLIGQNEAAFTHLTELTKDPGFPQIDKTDYYRSLGRVTESLGRWPQAAEVWERVAGLVGDGEAEHAEAAERAAHAYLETGTREAAVRADAILRSLEESVRADPQYLFDAGRAAHEVADPERALRLLGRFLEGALSDASPERIEALLRCCQIELDRGARAEAERLFSKLGTLPELPANLSGRMADVRARLGMEARGGSDKS
ncbi:MAG: hypothetical protein AB1486_22695 [Planctomycetota bacterium]